MKKVLTIRQEKKRPLKVNLTTSDTYAEEPARGPRTRNTESVIDGTKMTIKQKEMVPLRVLADDLIRTEDIVNTLDSDATDKPLSAAMGKVLREGVDALSPTAMDGYANKSDLEDFQESASAALEDKASIDGYYSTLTTGAAENLIGEDTVSAEFTRRTSGGGTDIGDGAATIATIKGNTLVWNQQIGISPTNLSISVNGVTITDNRDGSYTVSTDANGATAYTSINLPRTGNYIANHKVLTTGCPSGGSLSSYYFIPYAGYTGLADTGGGKIFTRSANITNPSRIVVESGGVITTPVTFRPQIIDLTQEFGSGNEPSTVAEFRALFPLNYYAYNTGSLLNLTATGLQTDGFNQWDEEWESGRWAADPGQVPTITAQNNRVCSKNFMRVFEGQTYYFYCGVFPAPNGSGFADIFGLDENKKFVDYIPSGGYFGKYTVSFTVPAGIKYICFNMYGSYGTTYKNDICINLSDVNKNGTYEKYWSETKALPITTATSGGVAIFSDGMKSAGTAHDEMTATKATKRIGVVDLGSFTWTKSGGGTYVFFTTGLRTIIKNGTSNVFSVPFIRGSASGDATGEINVDSAGTVYAALSPYTDADAFKAAMSGVYLYYELATPTEYTLDSALNLSYKVEDAGTETLLPENTSTPTTSPIVADIRYPFDAAGTINHLQQNYTSKPTMDNILTAFKTAGLISGYDLEYNQDNGNYDCDIE